MHDCVTGATDRRSVDSSGSQANRVSIHPSISAGGRVVAFESIADDLVAADTNGVIDVFVHDLCGAVATWTNYGSGLPGTYGAVVPRSSRPRATVTVDPPTPSPLRPSASSSSASSEPPDPLRQRPAVLPAVGCSVLARWRLVHGDDPHDVGLCDDIDLQGSPSTGGSACRSRKGSSSRSESDSMFDPSRIALLSVAFAGVATTSARAFQETTRASVDSAGTEGNNSSYDCGISSDGRFVAYWSDASNLVAGDTNNSEDVFVFDRATGSTERVSVDSSGNQVSAGGFVLSTQPLSGDGRFVTFTSQAAFDPGDTNGKRDIFVRDRVLGTTTRVSVDSAGNQGDGDSDRGALSQDGGIVVFESASDNLVAGDTNGVSDLFVRDLVNGTTERVSVDSSGIESDAWCTGPSISADGNLVAFCGAATNLVPGDTNLDWDVFVRDRAAGTTERVSVDSSGAQADQGSLYPAISADGRFVAFSSFATNLVAGDYNNYPDIFVHDRATGATTRVSVSSSGYEGNVVQPAIPPTEVRPLPASRPTSFRRQQQGAGRLRARQMDGTTTRERRFRWRPANDYRPRPTAAPSSSRATRRTSSRSTTTGGPTSSSATSVATSRTGRTSAPASPARTASRRSRRSSSPRSARRSPSTSAIRTARRRSACSSSACSARAFRRSGAATCSCSRR